MGRTGRPTVHDVVRARPALWAAQGTWKAAGEQRQLQKGAEDGDAIVGHGLPEASSLGGESGCEGAEKGGRGPWRSLRQEMRENRKQTFRRESGLDSAR